MSVTPSRPPVAAPSAAADVSVEVDARGLSCPLPILKTKKALATVGSGQLLKVMTTDPGARRDFEAFVRQTGHEMVEMVDGGGGAWTFFVKHR